MNTQQIETQTVTQTVGSTPAATKRKAPTPAATQQNEVNRVAEAQQAIEEQQVDAHAKELLAAIHGALTLGQEAVAAVANTNANSDTELATAIAHGIRSLGFTRVGLTQEDLKDAKRTRAILGDRGYAVVTREGKPPVFVADPVVMAALISALKAPASDVRRAIALGTPELVFAADLELTRKTLEEMRNAEMYMAPPKVRRGATELEWWEYALIGVAIALGAGGIAVGVSYWMWGSKSQSPQLPQL